MLLLLLFKQEVNVEMISTKKVSEKPDIFLQGQCLCTGHKQLTSPTYRNL